MCALLSIKVTGIQTINSGNDRQPRRCHRCPRPLTRCSLFAVCERAAIKTIQTTEQRKLINVVAVNSVSLRLTHTQTQTHTTHTLRVRANRCHYTDRFTLRAAKFSSVSHAPVSSFPLMHVHATTTFNTHSDADQSLILSESG